MIRVSLANCCFLFLSHDIGHSPKCPFSAEEEMQVVLTWFKEIWPSNGWN